MSPDGPPQPTRRTKGARQNTGRGPPNHIGGLGRKSGRSSWDKWDKEGPDERVDDDEFECESERDCNCVMDLDFASRSCAWYSEGMG